MGAAAVVCLPLSLSLPLLAGTAAAAAGDFSFDDPRIAESSGLVALADGSFVTTNDSGDQGRVFVVSATGKTLRVAHWSDDAVDQEALAPSGREDRVWVGDIGDNGARRDDVVLRLVGVGGSNAGTIYRTIRAVYPDGAHDAETLMRAPDGRLLIATKGFLGGTLYAVPAGEGAGSGGDDEIVTMEQISSKAAIVAMATDGGFLPDGRHFVVRGYVSATLYAWPSLERVGSMTLPGQRQGEGMAFSADGSLWLTSEGVRSTVLRRALSSTLAEAVAPSAAPTAAPTAAATSPNPALNRVESRVVPDRIPGSVESNDGFGRSPWPWLLGGLVGMGLLGYLGRSIKRPR